MLRLGFDRRWVGLVMSCIRSVSYLILFNGQEIGLIIASRVLSWGDLLSPYLFILYAKGLSALIDKVLEIGEIYGIQIARGAPVISHLLFAYDMFFGRASELKSRKCVEILARYGRASGQVVNFDKSMIFFAAMWREGFRRILEVFLVSIRVLKVATTWFAFADWGIKALGF